MKDINKCTAETVVRLASALGTEVSCIMNPIAILDGYSGKYRNIKYQWKKDSTMVLTLLDGKKKTVIPTGYHFRDPKKLKLYKDCTEFYIDEYIEKMAFEKEAEKIMRSRRP